VINGRNRLTDEDIWKEIGCLWQSLREDAQREPSMGTPPELLRVEERPAANFDSAKCLGNPVRAFEYDDDGRREVSTSSRWLQPTAARGALYITGYARFHVAPDGSRGVLEYQVGPRYGRGLVLEIGIGGRVIKSPRWVS
jgi:hypothetical protein